MYLWTGWCICICDVLVDFSVLSQIARATLPEKYIASHVWLPPVNEWQPPAPKKQGRNNQKVGSPKKVSTMDEDGKGGSDATETEADALH